MKPRIKKLWFGKYLCRDLNDTSFNGYGVTPQEAYEDHLKWKKYSEIMEKEGTLHYYFETERKKKHWFWKWFK